MEAVAIDRLEIVDEVGLEELGFDFARIQQLLEDRVLPKVMEELGRVPMTGPVFGGIANTYAILREVRTTESYLVAKADLFRAPAYDPTAPNTFIAEAPDRVVTPHDAAILLGGNDAEIPSELLRYRVSIDGVSSEPTYVRQVKVGAEGVTKTYRVEARAIDLAGNEDATPADVDVTVDGVLPEVRIETLLKGEIDTATPELAWTADDDLSPPSAIGGRIKTFDITDYGSPTEHDAFDFEPGDTATVLELRPGHEYRLVITVKDEAGNEGSEALVFSVSPDAEAPGAGCACSAAAPAGGASPVAPGLLLAGLALVAVRRRRAR
jgi:MYXO-CTERM domain-containing protein